MNVTRPLPARALLLVPIAAVVMLAACSSGPPPAPSSEVSADELESVPGVPDRGDDPAVVAIDVGGKAICSGALIAPGVVLTARHCVAKAAEPIVCPAHGSQVAGIRAPSSIEILVGDDVASAEERARGVEVLAPPGDVLCDADIALVLLDLPIEDVEPLDVRAHGVAQGDHVRAVGFSRDPDGARATTKVLRDHVKVLETSANEFLAGEATCRGDSGGPAIDEATGEIVGVVSRAGPTCDGKGAHDVFTRTDAFLALIGQALYHALGPVDAGPGAVIAGTGQHSKAKHKGKKGPVDMGAECKKASDCAAGVCVSQGARQYCSRSCDSHDHCPTHYKCQRSKQGHSVCIEH
jgi:hypothetical protein